MSRILKSDFDELIQFINTYSLSNIINDDERIIQLKSMHKRIFSLSNLAYTLQDSDKDNKFLSRRAYDYLNESISNLCSTLFMWLNGAYKPSKLVLRNCIETFVKAILCNENEDYLKIKNLYEVFDIASDINFFSEFSNKKYFHKLNNQYSELCLTVHSGDIKTNAKLETLGVFPSFDSDLSIEISKRFILIVDSIMFLIISNYYEEVFKMHHSIRDTILEGLPANLKKELSERYENE